MLGDAAARRRPGDGDVDVGADQRRLDVAVLFDRLEQQRAGAGITRPHIIPIGTRVRQRRERYYDKRKHKRS